MCRIDDCQDRCDGPHRHRQRGMECPDANLAVQSISTLFLRPGDKSSSVSILSPPSLITQALTGKSLPPPSFAPDLLCRDPFLNFSPLPSSLSYSLSISSFESCNERRFPSLPTRPRRRRRGESTRKEAKGRRRGEERDKSHKFLALPPPFFLLSLIPLFVAPRGGREGGHSPNSPPIPKRGGTLSSLPKGGEALLCSSSQTPFSPPPPLSTPRVW